MTVTVFFLFCFFNLFVYFPLKDSGQAIPRVVESCIRYINLYGKCLSFSQSLRFGKTCTAYPGANNESSINSY